MKKIDWSYMVVRRIYRSGACEARVIDRKSFTREDHPENREQYRQEFFPCVTLEQAIKVLCGSIFRKKAKHLLKL